MGEGSVVMRIYKLSEEKIENRCRSITNIYIYIMVTAFPLFTGLDGYIRLNEKKFVFFAVCTVCWALFLCFQTALRLAGRGRLFIRPAAWLMLSFMGACVISTILSPEASVLSISTGRCDGLLTYLLYGCIFLGVSRFGTEKESYIYAFGASYTICSLIVLAQLYGYNPLSLYPNGLTYYEPFVQETGRFLGTVGNIDLFSALSCLAIPIMCSGCVNGAGRRRFLLLMPAALGLICVVSISVAAGVFALIITAVVFFPALVTDLYRRNLVRSDLGGLSERTLRCGAVVIAVLASAAAITAIYFWSGDGVTIRELQSMLHGEVRGSFGSSRVLIWENVLEVIRKHPLFGIGPDCLGNIMDVRFTRYSAALGETLVTTVDNAHNEYLQILVSFGLCGFLPLAAAQVLSWTHIIHNRRKNRVISLICPGLFCYMVQAFFNLGLCITTPIFCVFWALTWTRKVGTSPHGHTDDFNECSGNIAIN